MTANTLTTLLDACGLERIPPGLRFSLRRAFAAVDEEADCSAPSERTTRALWRCLDEAEPWAGLDPDLAQVGHALLEPTRHHELRRFGCAWSTLFPTAETMRRLAEVARADETPAPVREQAIWTLGYRQSRRQPTAVRWTQEAVDIADAALVAVADEVTTAGRIPFDDLPLALRHVQSPELSAVFEKAPLLWGNAYEAFATPSLARTLLERIDELPNDHQRRAMRLAAATLGEAATPLLLAKAKSGIADHLELLFLAITVGGESHVATLEETIAGYVGADLLRQRARWHVEHPGVVPTVRALGAIRTTALIEGEDRRAVCELAADDFAALVGFGRHGETYLYTLWETAVNAAEDPVRARALTTTHPESRGAVKALYLRDLAARGRAKQVVASAQQLEGVEEGACALAMHGRPFVALELAATSRLNVPEVALARVLGLYRAGRPDLATRVLAEELPPAEVTSLDVMPSFPGDHERWLVEHHPKAYPAVTALVGGLEAVLAQATSAPVEADPDSFSFETIGDLERWLARPIDGATVFLAGEFPGDTKARHAEAITERGGRLVDGPFPGTHYYVMGLTCLVTIVAKLERQGTRRIRNEEIGLPW